MQSRPRSTAEYYHERTKYRADNLSGPGLDWSTKPPVFKEYPGADSIPLHDRLPFSDDTPIDLRDLPRANGELSLEAIARLLFFTNGITGVMQQPGDYHFYRAAPSAGALYPTEIYLAARNVPGLPSGIYNFHVREHKLVPIAPAGFSPIDAELFEALGKACLDSKVVGSSDLCLIFSTIFFRSSWRYGPRAYRRCMLDTGHVLGNLAAYAPLEGFACLPSAAFVDAEFNELLALDPDKEGVCVVAPLLASTHDAVTTPYPRAARSSRFSVSGEPEQDRLLVDLARRSSIGREDLAMASSREDRIAAYRFRAAKLRFQPGVSFDRPPPALREELAQTILSRRSTRAFNSEAIDREHLGHMLEYAYRYDLAGEEWEAPRFFDAPLLETWVVVHRVSGMQSGVYSYLPDKRELKLVYAGDFRTQLHYLALGQELASDSAAVVIHTCDLPAAVEAYGDRAYRILHLDAGHIGERLNLAAIALGLGASGIGGFLDEEVNALLYLPENEACVYITCLGVPA